MTKLTTDRRFGGIFLMLIGFFFVIGGFATIFLGATFIVDFISLFLGNIQLIISTVGLLTIIFGFFLIWAGRTIRNEPFLPQFLRGK